MSKINYKYNEDKLLKEFASYVDKTYENITQKTNINLPSSLLIVGMVKVFVLGIL